MSIKRPSYVQVKRENQKDVLVSYELKVAKRVYKGLLQDLINCCRDVDNISTKPTTLVQTIPKECLTATNLTQSWRLDHKGSDIRPGGPHSYNNWACDLHKDLQWFRFSGDGGIMFIHHLFIYVISLFLICNNIEVHI